MGFSLREVTTALFSHSCLNHHCCHFHYYLSIFAPSSTSLYCLHSFDVNFAICIFFMSRLLLSKLIIVNGHGNITHAQPVMVDPHHNDHRLAISDMLCQVT